MLFLDFGQNVMLNRLLPSLLLFDEIAFTVKHYLKQSMFSLKIGTYFALQASYFAWGLQD